MFHVVLQMRDVVNYEKNNNEIQKTDNHNCISNRFTIAFWF